MHFQPLHNEVKSVLGLKESYSIGNIARIANAVQCHNLKGQKSLGLLLGDVLKMLLSLSLSLSL